jgi:nucleoid-associated protein YgaU
MIAVARAARVITTILIELATVLALVAVGRRPELAVPVGHLGPWLREGDAATVLVALLRWAALLGAGWLLGSTLLYVAASVARAPAAVRAVGWSTLPAVRRTIDAACAVSVAASVVLAPAAAGAAPADDPPSVTVVRDGRGLAQLPPATMRSPAPVTAPAAPTAPAATAPATVDPATVVVAPGDNLWVLATRRLADASRRAPETVPDIEVAPYWVRVCDANRDRLASRDPNLVLPGELVVLPPVS